MTLRPGGGSWRWAAALGASFAVACGLVTMAYRIADAGQDVGRVYAVFWLGMAAFSVPAFVRLLSHGAGTAERYGVIALLAALCALPKVLRSWGDPVYHDEIIHWRQTERMQATGDLFNANPVIPIIEDFPLIHALLNALSTITGLDTWAVAVGLTAALRPIALVGIVVVGRNLGLSTRTAAIGAALYAMSPNFLFFDGQFAYESVGVVLVVWGVAGVTAILAGRGSRPVWALLTCGLSLALATTHHLSSYALFTVTAAVCVGVALRGRRRGRRDPALAWLLGLGAVQLIAITSWTLSRGAAIHDYLGPVVLPGLGQLVETLLPWLGDSGTRAPLGTSSAPAWARAAALATPFVLLAAFLAGCWRVRRARSRIGVIALAILGASYFPGLLLTLTESGAEAGHRTAAFAFIGLCIVIAPVVASPAWRARSGATAMAVLTGVTLLTFVGNATTGAATEFMFPGPHVFGDDARATDEEAGDVSRALVASGVPRPGVLTDRYLGLAVLRDADARTAFEAPPLWEVYFRPGPIRGNIADGLRRQGVDFVTVDRRMFRARPLLGDYTEPREPRDFRLAGPPAASQGKLVSQRWAARVYSSTNVDLYRIDPFLLPHCGEPRSARGPVAGCTP